jgi:hypothetical protein
MEKILSGTVNGKPWNPKVSDVPVEAEESWPDYALRMGYTGVKSAVTGAAAPVQLLQQGITKLLPKDIQETMQNAPQQEGVFQRAERNLPEAYSKAPEGFWENVYANTAAQLPFLAMGGLPGILSSLPAAIGASAGSEVAKEAGLGPLAQFASGIAGGGLVGGLKGFKGDPIAWARRTYNKDYKNLENKLSQNPLPGDATQYAKDLSDIELKLMKSDKDVTKQITPYLSKRKQDIYGEKLVVPNISKKVNNIKKALKEGKMTFEDANNKIKNLIEPAPESRITFNDVNDKTKSLKEALRDGTIKGTASRKLAYEMVDAAENHLAREGKLHPDYGTIYERSKDLYAADKGTAFIRHLSKNNRKLYEEAVTNPRTESLLSGTLGKGIKLVSTPIKAAGSRIIKDLDFLLTNKHIQEQLKSIVKAASLGDKAVVLSRIGQLDKAVSDVFPDQEIILSGNFTAKE